MSIILQIHYDTIFLPRWLTYMLDPWVRDLIKLVNVGTEKITDHVWIAAIPNLQIEPAHEIIICSFFFEGETLFKMFTFTQLKNLKKAYRLIGKGREKL